MYYFVDEEKQSLERAKLLREIDDLIKKLEKSIQEQDKAAFLKLNDELAEYLNSNTLTQLIRII